MRTIWQDGKKYFTVDDGIFIQEGETCLKFFVDMKKYQILVPEKREALIELKKRILSYSKQKAMVEDSFIICGMLILVLNPFMRKSKVPEIQNMIVDFIIKKVPEKKPEPCEIPEVIAKKTAKKQKKKEKKLKKTEK